MEPKNREQRRREKYGKAGGATTSPWPASEDNPVLKRAADDPATPSGESDKDVVEEPPAVADEAPAVAEADPASEDATQSGDSAKS
jgi:hypothetical protein